MAHLDNHLEQITLSAKALGELPFPPPKIFTNALLGNHEITNLIRDTEPHERALYSVDPNVTGNTSLRKSNRRGTVFPGEDVSGLGRKSIYVQPEPRKVSAVARVLGGDMLQEIQKSSHSARNQRNGDKPGVNVEILLRGAEKLCAVYPVAGASEKIISLRNRYKQITESIAQYEEKVAKQQVRLDKMNKGSDFGSDNQDEDESYEGDTIPNNNATTSVTEEDLRLEEQEVKELEAKKRALEERVAGMEKDLGGLLR